MAEAAAAKVVEAGEKTARTARTTRPRSQTKSRSRSAAGREANVGSSESQATVEQAAERQLDEKG